MAKAMSHEEERSGEAAAGRIPDEMMKVAPSTEGQSRLDTAKMVMQDILQGLQGQTVSLYAFTSELTPIVPPTLDYLFTRLAIKNLHIDEGGVGGTRFGPVLTELKKEAFPDPKQTHLHLLTVGIGSLEAEPIPNVTFKDKPVLSKLEPEILKELASRERGQYLMANSGNSWDLAQKILSEIKNNRLSDSAEMQSERKVAAIQQQDFIFDLYYQIPIGIALFFYLLNLLLPDVYRL
jgi:Ca-activated chloride channel family protein